MINSNNKKIIHLSIIIVIIVAIIFAALMVVLNYYEEGETNMPFSISKISIISTTDGQDIEDKENKNKWNLQVDQNNDIYVYIEKNNSYTKIETIKEVKIDNIVITKNPAIGNIAIYKPSKNQNAIFENNAEYETQEISFEGSKATNIQDLKISNQGGIAAFRCANNNLSTYISNDGEEVAYSGLLKKLNIDNESIKASISFDITIVLNSKKSFKATFSVDIPEGNIVEEGTTSAEITDLDDIVFKRIEN